LAAAEAILEVEPGAEIVLLSEEDRPPYARPLISYWLAGETPAELFPLPTQAIDRTDFRRGRRAVGLDAAARRLDLDDGASLSYDRLLLATGAAPRPLGLVGEGAPNVFGFRTWGDAEAIDAAIRAGARRAVVLGAGLVGVKASEALAARGLEVTLCASSPQPLSQVVDDEAGSLAAQALREEGIQVFTGWVPEGFEFRGARVSAVRFAPPGGTEDCDLVIRAKGVSSRAELAGEAGGARGIPVDPTLRTALPRVWAAGDAARGADGVRGEPWSNALWPIAEGQGRAAGRAMAGCDERYEDNYARNSLRVGPLHLVSAGVLRPSGEGFDARTRRFPGGDYRKVVCREGCLVGFVSVSRDSRACGADGMVVAAVGRGARLDELPFSPLDPKAHWGNHVFSGDLGR
jgi:NADPH-dependent 2,4-dienoyl-CoA reductase/sulfur reductase-like enzyme